MPYVRCPSCGLRSYSAARYSNRDTCPRCHETFVVAEAVEDGNGREPVAVGPQEDDED